MPTNHGETLHDRYEREHRSELEIAGRMTPDDVYGLIQSLHNAEAELAALKAVPDEVRKDAERYRWLCDGNGYLLEQLSLCGHSDQKAEADAAIDAAMSHTSDA